MTYLRKKWANNNKGSALLVAMGMVFLVGATTSGLFYQGLNHSRFGERFLAQTRAIELANSGIELVRYTLRHSASDCFSTEIAAHTLFNAVPLGEDGHFTVEVLASENNPYTARVISTGTYTPINTTAKIEAKMTCGFLSALDNYSILTVGDLIVSGPVTADGGDYDYSDIHADGSVTFLGTVEIPEGGITITQAEPITTTPPEGVTVTQTSTVSGMPLVSADAFRQQMNSFFPGIGSAGRFTFNSNGSVTDRAGNTVLEACSPCTPQTNQTYLGMTYTPPPAGPAGSGSAMWSATAPASMTPDTTYVVSDANLHVSAPLGSELNPLNVTFVVKNGNLEAAESIALTKQRDMGNPTARPVSLVVDGTSQFMQNVYLKDTTIVNGGTVAVAGTLNLNNGALIAGDDTQLASVNFEQAYDGSPINYHEEVHGDMLKMKAKQSEYTFGGLQQQTSVGTTSTTASPTTTDTVHETTTTTD